MSSGVPRRRTGVTEPIDLAGGPLPPWAERRATTLPAGASLPYDRADWVDAIVVVEAGEVDLACTKGGRRRFGVGALLPLEVLPLVAIENPGVDDLVLVSIRRRNRSAGDRFGGG